MQFFTHPLGILIWWYPLLRSILDNIVAPDIKSNILSKRRMRKQCLTVILLIAWLPHTCVMRHPSLALKVREPRMGSNSLWSTLCQVTPLSVFVILRARQGSSCNGASLEKLLLRLGQWHVECLSLEATHLPDLWGGIQKTLQILI